MKKLTIFAIIGFSIHTILNLSDVFVHVMRFQDGESGFSEIFGILVPFIYISILHLLSNLFILIFFIGLFVKQNNKS
jgi:hypothetical protein